MPAILINDFSRLNLKQNSVVTIGKFDGVHLGHQSLLTETVKIAKENNFCSIAMVFRKQKPTMYTFDENIEYIQGMGIDYIIVIDFSIEFYRMTPHEFFCNLIEYYLVKHIVVGLDFCFGRDRMGNVDTLREYGKLHFVELSVLESLKRDGVRISTSSIRKCLMDGEVSIASEMLGRNYAISGVVERGRAIGREIGFPTANIYVANIIVLPKEGVYHSLVSAHGVCYKALTFIGTSKINEGLRLETHILDFSNDIYEETIKVYLLEYSRENIKIDSIKELKDLIEQDETKTRDYFTRRERCL